MFRIYLILLSVLLFNPCPKAQNMQLSQAKLKALNSWNPHNTKQLPNQVSLKQYAPAIGNQGLNNTCVGWAIGYGAMTIQKAKAKGLKDKSMITQNAFSPNFIYQQIKKNSCNARVTLIEGIEIVSQQGNISYIESNPENTTCTTRFNSFQKKRAKQNAIAQTTLLFKKAHADDKKINHTKTALALGYPVVLSLSVRKNFYQLSGGKYWWPTIGNTTPMGGHALVIVAYDDKKQAFQLMNSWGTEWGRGGFVWVKYKDFARFAKHAFCLAEL